MLTWCIADCKKLAPIWEQLATDFANDDSVIIAKIDAEAANSKATAIAYDVKGYPTLKWFPAGSEKPESYEGGRTEEALVKFINEKAGTHRLPGGELDATAGTVDVLSDIVAKYTSYDKLAEVAEATRKSVESLKGDAQYKYAEYYVRVFDKLNSSDNYVAKELARLDGILAKGGLAPSKRDELKSKFNILRQIADAVGEKFKSAHDEL